MSERQFVTVILHQDHVRSQFTNKWQYFNKGTR